MGASEESGKSTVKHHCWWVLFRVGGGVGLMYSAPPTGKDLITGKVLHTYLQYIHQAPPPPPPRSFIGSAGSNNESGIYTY